MLICAIAASLAIAGNRPATALLPANHRSPPPPPPTKLDGDTLDSGFGTLGTDVKVNASEMGSEVRPPHTQTCPPDQPMCHGAIDGAPSDVDRTPTVRQQAPPDPLPASVHAAHLVAESPGPDAPTVSVPSRQQDQQQDAVGAGLAPGDDTSKSDFVTLAPTEHSGGVVLVASPKPSLDKAAAKAEAAATQAAGKAEEAKQKADAAAQAATQSAAAAGEKAEEIAAQAAAKAEAIAATVGEKAGTAMVSSPSSPAPTPAAPCPSARGRHSPAPHHLAGEAQQSLLIRN
jgi:hypothetical protein